MALVTFAETKVTRARGGTRIEHIIAERYKNIKTLWAAPNPN
jgi:hypothetical protein